MMADEAESGELAAEDKAYFESRGEKLPQEKPQEKPDEEEKAETETKTEADELLADDTAKEPEKVDKKVPLRALTESRENEKRAKAALLDAEKRAAILEDRWNTILQLNQQPEVKTEEDPEPDPNQDIFAHNAWLKRQFDKVNKTVTEREQSEAKTREETQRENAVWNFWNEDAKTFKAQTADFEEAVQFMSGLRTNQLRALSGLNPQFKSDAGIVQQINNELKDIIIAAAQQQRSPAEYIYTMAKEWGYKGPAPKEEPKLEDNPLWQAAGKLADKRLDKLSKDMEAETSLSSAGGSRPGTGLTAKDIADMSPDQFEAWYAKHGAGGFKRLQTRGNA